MKLESLLSTVPKIGAEYFGRLRENGFERVIDLLHHIPFRYEDLRHKSTTVDFPLGQLTFFEGYVEKVSPLPSRSGKKMYKGLFRDEKGTIPVLWFNNRFVLSTFKKDKKVRLIGKIEHFSQVPTLMSPTWESYQDVSPHIGRIVPVYHEFNGITTKWLRSRVWDILQRLESFPVSIVPEDLEKQKALLPLADAYRELHFPTSYELQQQSRHRLAYDELFTELLRQHLIREAQRSTREAPRVTFDTLPELEPFYRTLPFELSDSQRLSIEEMLKDMQTTYAMRRMLIGDVGSGKTVVAAALMHAISEKGMRSVIMAPTQILAQQHFITLQKFLSPHNISVGLVEGNESKKYDTSMLSTYRVLVGTHALLYKETLGEDIGFVVVDEQHRFGVSQREKLSDMIGRRVHFLSMTATPIPRSLSLVLLGHVDVSYLFTRVGGRKESETKVVPFRRRVQAYEWAQKYVRERGGQIFVVCPFITPSENIESVKAATTEFEFLRNEVFAKLRVELLHGGMKAAEKDRILGAFRNGEFDVLVTTPVVEVGIDIPNANFIIIESAERFGLAQLHQLRGRVGRAGQDAYCFLIPTDEKGDNNKRLHAMTTTHDGFALAEIDLSQRGSGTVFGTLQSGFSGFRFVDISEVDFITAVKGDVDTVIVRMNDGDLPHLAQQLMGGLDFGRH